MVISVPLLATCAIVIAIALSFTCTKSDPRQRLNNGDDGGGDGGGSGGSGGGCSRIDTDCDQIDESLGGKADDYPAPIKSGDAVDKDGIRKRGKPS